MHRDPKEMLAHFKGMDGATIPVLQKVQEEYGYLSEELISQIADFLHISKNEVYGVATFYTQFRFNRPGDHTIKVCLGTACHVRGGQRIMDELERFLNVHPGGTTKDHQFGLERVACFGSCALAPVVVVDSDVYGRMTPAKAKDTLKKYQKAPQKAG
ncbi:MAG: NADH-quinone oxidoreductase subunit NuoE [Chloroflexi bacterium]|nr:NADH-quinone oxidoreductase subunit NuoE [Chloroflexota bacterium]